MNGIIVAFQKQEDAISIKNILVRNGYKVSSVCTTGTHVLAAADDYNDGIVVCGYKITDMLYYQLRESLPKEFEMLVLASPAKFEGEQYEGVVNVAMPLKIYDLINTVEMLNNTIIRRKKKRKNQPKTRSPEDMRKLKDAKDILMNRNNMSEEEAHRYMQKISMDSGVNMVETAEMILNLY